MNARDSAKCFMHCFHLIPILTDEVSSHAQMGVLGLKGLDNLPRVAHLENGDAGTVGSSCFYSGS